MNNYKVRILKRNTGQLIFRYEWRIWLNDNIEDYGFGMTKLGSRFAAWRAARVELGRIKRAKNKNPVIVSEYEKKLR